jgi:sulfur carrier protein ThiS
MSDDITLQVQFYGGLEKYTAEKQTHIQTVLRAGASLSDLLAHLGIPRTLPTLVFTNDQILPLEAILPDGAAVKIFPPIAGG